MKIKNIILTTLLTFILCSSIRAEKRAYDYYEDDEQPDTKRLCLSMLHIQDLPNEILICILSEIVRSHDLSTFENVIETIKYLVRLKHISRNFYYLLTPEQIRNFLEAANVDINVRNCKGQTVLHQAACGNTIDTIHKTVITHALLAGGSDIYATINNPGYPFHGMTALHLATITDNTNFIQILLNTTPYEQRVNIANIKNHNDQTALHLATWRNKVDIIQTLLDAIPYEQRANFANQRDKHGCTALHIAVNRNQAEAVYALLDAIPHEQKTTVTNATIIKPHSVYHDMTALHAAAYQNNANIIYALITVKTDINTKNSNGRTALHIAACYDKTIAMQILTDYKANVDARDNNNWTALHIAAWKGNINAVQDLIDARANIYVTIDNPENKFHGWTALHLAAWGDKVDVIHALLDAAPPELIVGFINIRDALGFTALDLAISKKNAASIVVLIYADILVPIDLIPRLQEQGIIPPQICAH